MKCLMNNIRSYSLGIAIVAMTVPMFGQTPSKQVPSDSQQQAQSQTSSTASQSSMQTFQGTISESQGTYVLKESSGVTYQLDNQKKAKDFSGQSVKVKGTLETSSNTIHVASIKPGA
jgi:short subunit dehydrogenase-like uncharacterized protein